MPWVTRHATFLSVLLVGVFAIVSIAGVLHEGNQRRKADAWAQERSLAQVCESIVVNKDALLELMGVVLAADPQEEPNLDALPEFRAVDPEVQDLIRVLVSSPSSSVRDRLVGFRDGLEAAPLPDFCV